MSTALSSFRRQQLLLEYASTKYACPEGVYLSPGATRPTIWSGVLFVSEGPYSSAIIRFTLDFPPSYPEECPSITVATEIFHPLVVPLTTYTFASGANNPNVPVSASDAERLQPGHFNLQHVFPLWCRGMKHEIGSRSTLKNSAPSISINGQESEAKNDLRDHSLLAVLTYFKSAFISETALDSVPITAALNINAWHAWRAHRGMPRVGSRPISLASQESGMTGKTPPTPGRNPGDWNWDGVWESRVREGIQDSIGEQHLYSSRAGKVNNGATPFKFAKYDDAKVELVQQAMFESLGLLDLPRK